VTKQSTPEVGSEVLSCSYVANEIHDSSTRLTREYQLLADDLNPGSHLEVGESINDRYMPGGLEGTQVTSPNPAPARDADNRKASRAHGPCRAGLLSSDSGMSEYPVPSYLEQIGNGLCPRV